jgi:hypothetical protein
MLPVCGGGAGTFTPGLRQLHPSSVTSILSALPAVGPQRRRPLDVPSGSVRPHYRRFGLAPLAAGPQARRLQVGRSVVSHLAWRGSYLNVLRRTADLVTRQHLRSSASGRLEVNTVGRRSFAVAALLLWNTAFGRTNCADAACLSS